MDLYEDQIIHEPLGCLSVKQRTMLSDAEIEERKWTIEEPYYVEQERPSCTTCGEGELYWVIHGPTGVAGSTSYSEEADAQEECSLRNMVHKEGRHSVLQDLQQTRRDLREFIETLEECEQIDGPAFYMAQNLRIKYGWEERDE